MATSETAAASEWIETLEPDTWFWGSDVPGRSTVVRPLLSRLVHSDEIELRRVAHGLYWRGYPAGSSENLFGPHDEMTGLIWAGSGAGLARWGALNRLNWCEQIDPKASISVIGTRLRPPTPLVRYRPHSNTRRLDLTWAEVTVLEALGMIRYTEKPWDGCIEAFVSGGSASKFWWDFEFDGDRALWAAAAEPGDRVSTLYHLERLVDATARSGVAVGG